MPWYFPWSESIKKRACRYLLQHYLGDFLKEKLDLDQLTVDLYNGKGTITNVPLDVWALNEMISNAGIPLDLVDGYISSISVSVPWKALLSDNCEIEISGLNLTFTPKQKIDEGYLIDSNHSWNSMTTSIQLAQDCLRQESVDESSDSSQSFEGLEAFAQTIESVLSRVRLSFIDSQVRLEHLPLDSISGVGVELHVDRIDYCDLSHDEVGLEKKLQHSVYELVAIAIKNFQMTGVNIYIDEFQKQKRTRLREAVSGEFPNKSNQHVFYESSGYTKVRSTLQEKNDEEGSSGLLPKTKIISSCGKQNMKVKLKQNDDVMGPKVDIDYSLGGLNIFLSPRQLHLLIDVISTIPEASGNGQEPASHSKATHNRMREMKSEDFVKVEESLQHQFQSLESHSLKHQLNCLKFGDNTSLGHHSTSNDEEFFSMTDFPLPALGQPTLLNTVKHHNLSSNNIVGLPSSSRSSLSNVSLGGSSGSLNTKGTLTERASTVFRASSVESIGHKVNLCSPANNTGIGLAGLMSLDDSTEVSHFKLRSSNILCILLYRNPCLTDRNDDESLTLQKMSEVFFTQVNQYARQSLFGIGGDRVREQLLSICCTDHIRVLASAVTLEMELRNQNSMISMSTDLIIGKLEANENLYDNTSSKKEKQTYSQTNILKFELEEESSLYPGTFGSNTSPNLKIKHFKTHGPTLTAIHTGFKGPARSSLSIDFGTLITEIDMTIVDRISAIIYPGQLYKLKSPSHQTPMYDSLATGRFGNTNTAFQQVIDDIPQLNDVKTDLTIKCQKVKVLLRIPVPDLLPSSDIDKRPWWRKAIHKESLELNVKAFELKSTLKRPETFDITFLSVVCNFLALDSSFHLFTATSSSNTSPSFAGVGLARILITSSTPNRSVFEEAKCSIKNSSPDSIDDEYSWMWSDSSPFSTQQTMYEDEEMILPGSVAEMNAFQESATSCSRLAINCYFPVIHLNLHTNDVFELLYNRLFGDLILWESLAPSMVDLNLKQHNPYESVHINLASQIGHFESSNDKFYMCRSAIRDAYISDEGDSSFFSTDYTDSPNHQDQQTKFCFSLHIDEGEVALFPPCKDGCENVSSSEGRDTTSEKASTGARYGHVVVSIKHGHFFTASGYKGKPDVDYVGVYVNAFTLFHSDLLNSELNVMLMTDALNTLSLCKTIDLSHGDAKSKSKIDEMESTPMLSLAMKGTWHIDTNRKDNLLTVAVHGGTVYHRTLPSDHSWLFQLIDFMSIKDYPIVGYSFPSTVTSLHTHFLSCAVDFRPVHIPIHALLTTGSFNFSSNLSPESRTSVLRFLIDDSRIYICDHSTNLEVPCSNNYVNVMDMGVFELSLKSTDGLDTSSPIIDLSMSNNMLNIRTCSDSCVALIKLLKYFACDGDLKQVDSDVILEEEEISPQPKLEEFSLSSTDPTTFSDDIGSLMAEAMIDADSLKPCSNCSGTAVDESLSQSEDEISSSGEFCHLNDDSANQNLTAHQPSVRKLVSTEIHIIDDYFKIPFHQHDLLGSPDKYPPPSHRYTIREMSVTWQMYGGKDFGQKRNSISENDKSFKDYPGRQDSSSNRFKGGPNRCLGTMMELQLTKVRFQHEVYPENSKHIHRDILLVYDFELRDRLISSQINKFLYRFSSESLPKQSSVNMLTFKVIVSKPDDEARSKEAALRVSLQPLRLNVDQDSLFFLKQFMAEIFVKEEAKISHQTNVTIGCIANSPKKDVLSNNEYPIGSDIPGAHKLLEKQKDTECLERRSSSNEIFINSFVFSPDVPIRLDYQGKHINIEQGTLIGLLIGLSQLNCSELRLKRLCCRSGLLGFDKLLNYVLQEWVNDIKQNQLRSILVGFGPTYSILQLCHGIKDLFLMPVQQYRQDGRIVRGIQRGAHSFTTSTAMAVLELSNRLVSTIQGFAELTFDMVSPGPSHVFASGSRATKPAELREGVVRAYEVLSQGLTETASNIMRVATEEHDKKGMTGAVGGVLRQIPPSIVKPLILATEATSNVLGGAMNQLAPDKRRESMDKWKLEH